MDEEVEIVGIELTDEIIQRGVDLYARFAECVNEISLPADPEGWTVIIIAFKGFLDQIADATGVCPACIASDVLHKLGEEIVREGGNREKFH